MENRILVDTNRLRSGSLSSRTEDREVGWSGGGGRGEGVGREGDKCGNPFKTVRFVCVQQRKRDCILHKYDRDKYELYDDHTLPSPLMRCMMTTPSPPPPPPLVISTIMYSWIFSDFNTTYQSHSLGCIKLS